MTGFKKIIIVSYEENGDMSIKQTLGLKKTLLAKDFPTAKKLVAAVIGPHVLGVKRFVVEWQRDGYSEGYMVIL